MATSKDVQAGVDDLANKLGKSVLIEDSDQYPIWWSTKGDVDPIRQNTILYRNVEPAVADVVRKFKIRQATEPVRTPELPELGMWSRISMPIRHEEKVVGFVWILDQNQEVSKSDFSHIKSLAELASDELGNSASEKSKQAKLRETLIDRLLHGPDEKTAIELAQLERIPVESRIQVDAYGKIGGWRLPDGFTAHIETKTKRDATSGDSVPLIELATAYKRAVLTQRAINAGAVLPVATWNELGPWRLIVEAPETLAVSDIHPGAQVLLDPANVELLETARALLDSSGDVTSIAKKLFIHRTTLYYRMDRILELTGVDLRDASSRMQLQLALWLAAFRGTKP